MGTQGQPSEGKRTIAHRCLDAKQDVFVSNVERPNRPNKIFLGTFGLLSNTGPNTCSNKQIKIFKNNTYIIVCLKTQIPRKGGHAHGGPSE